MSLQKIYEDSSNFEKLKDEKKIKHYELIKNEVDKLREKEWTEFKQELINLFDNNPLNVYKIIKRTTWAVLYNLEIRGASTCIGNKLKGNQTIELSDFTPKYQEIFSNERLFNNFKRFVNIRLENNEMAEVITQGMIINPDLITLDELISELKSELPRLLIEKEASTDEKKKLLINTYQTIKDESYKQNLMDNIDKLKPIYEFIRSDFNNIINYITTASQKGINVNRRGLKEIQINNYIPEISRNLTIQKNAIKFSTNITSKEETNKKLESKNELIKNYKDKLEDHIDKIDELIEKMSEDEKKPLPYIFKELKNKNITLKSPEKGSLSNYLKTKKEVNSLETKKAELETEYIEMINQSDDKHSQYHEIGLYLELGDVCRLLMTESPLSNIRNNWETIKGYLDEIEELDDLETPILEGLADKIVDMDIGITKEELISSGVATNQLNEMIELYKNQTGYNKRFGIISTKDYVEFKQDLQPENEPLIIAYEAFIEYAKRTLSNYKMPLPVDEIAQRELIIKSLDEINQELLPYLKNIITSQVQHGIIYPKVIIEQALIQFQDL